MRLFKAIAASSVLLGLLLIGLAGWSVAEESKQLVFLFTTDTSGELNPCG